MSDYGAISEYHRGYMDGRSAHDAREWSLAHDRDKAIAELRGLTLDKGSSANLSAILRCIHEPPSGWTQGACELARDELIHLLGGDGNHAISVSFMDDLYGWACDGIVAERDELQAKVDQLTDLIRDAAQDYQSLLKANELRMGVLDAALEERKKLRESKLEMPRDANGAIVRLGDCLHDLEDGHVFPVDGLMLCDNSYLRWWAYQENGVQYPVVCCEIILEENDTPESIVRDLTLGKISQSDAVRRIGELNARG